MSVSVLAEEWLYDVLMDDVAIEAAVGERIYKAPAIAQPVYPCIVFGMNSSDSVATLGDSDALQDIEIEAVVVAQTEDDTSVAETASRLDALLDNAQATVVHEGTTHVFRVQKLREINEALIEGTYRYLRLGGVYRFRYQGTTA